MKSLIFVLNSLHFGIILKSTLRLYSAIKRCPEHEIFDFQNGIPYMLLSMLRSTLGPYSAIKGCPEHEILNFHMEFITFCFPY
jgi:hypothetical protein